MQHLKWSENEEILYMDGWDYGHTKNSFMLSPFIPIFECLESHSLSFVLLKRERRLSSLSLFFVEKKLSASPL